MAARVLLVLLVITLAGCSSAAWPERPANWQDGAELAAFRGGKTHSADEEFSLYGPDGPEAPPARCVAYQEGRADPRDSCSIEGPATDFEGRTWGPWTLNATWDGAGERLHEDVELHPEHRTVVAFGANGEVVAWWAGKMDAEAHEFWTE